MIHNVKKNKLSILIRMHKKQLRKSVKVIAFHIIAEHQRLLSGGPTAWGWGSALLLLTNVLEGPERERHLTQCSGSQSHRTAEWFYPLVNNGLHPLPAVVAFTHSSCKLGLFLPHLYLSSTSCSSGLILRPQPAAHSLSVPVAQMLHPSRANGH